MEENNKKQTPSPSAYGAGGYASQPSDTQPVNSPKNNSSLLTITVRLVLITITLAALIAGYIYFTS